MEHYRGHARIQKKRETPPDLLFHGRLLLTPPFPDETAFFSAYEHMYRQEPTLNYLGYRKPAHCMTRSRWCSLPGAAFDALVIERLLTLERADITMKDRVKATLEQVYHQQAEDFISIPQQIEGIQTQLLENAKKRVKTSVDDPLYGLLEEEQSELMVRQQALEIKKEKLGIVDSSEEIKQLHTLLGNFEAIWPTFDLDQRQRTFSLLVNRIEVEVVSPHWLRLSLDWLDAVCPRIDIAYIWKASPSRGARFSDEENAMIRQHYPRTPYMDLLQMLPNRTWQSIQNQIRDMGIKREVPADPGICTGVCYRDMVPKLDGHYLFRDAETTLAYIKEAIRNTTKSEAPFYAFWVLSDHLAGLTDLLVQWHLDGENCLSHAS